MFSSFSLTSESDGPSRVTPDGVGDGHESDPMDAGPTGPPDLTRDGGAVQQGSNEVGAGAEWGGRDDGMEGVEEAKGGDQGEVGVTAVAEPTGEDGEGADREMEDEGGSSWGSDFMEGVEESKGGERVSDEQGEGVMAVAGPVEAGDEGMEVDLGAGAEADPGAVARATAATMEGVELYRQHLQTALPDVAAVAASGEAAGGAASGGRRATKKKTRGKSKLVKKWQKK